MYLYESVKENLKESVQDLGTLAPSAVKKLDWPDGTIASWRLNDLETIDFINIAKAINEADYIFKTMNHLCIYSKSAFAFSDIGGGRHFSDFKSDILI